MRTTSQFGHACEFKTNCQLNTSICHSAAFSVPAGWTTGKTAISNLCWLRESSRSNSMLLTCFFIFYIYGIGLWEIFIAEDSGCHSVIKKRHDWLTTVISIYRMKGLWKSLCFQARFPLHDLEIHFPCLQKTWVLESDFIIPKENNNITLVSKGKRIKGVLFRETLHFFTSLPVVAGLLLPHHHSEMCIRLGMSLNFVLWLAKMYSAFCSVCRGGGIFLNPLKVCSKWYAEFFNMKCLYRSEKHNQSGFFPSALGVGSFTFPWNRANLTAVWNLSYLTEVQTLSLAEVLEKSWRKC